MHVNIDYILIIIIIYKYIKYRVCLVYIIIAGKRHIYLCTMLVVCI